MVCGFFLAYEDYGGKFLEVPACVFFFFKVEISSRAQIPLIKAKDQSTVDQ